MVERCEGDDDTCAQPATWVIVGMGPGCSDWSCCGWDEYACDDHRDGLLTESIAALGPAWGLEARPYGASQEQQGARGG